MLTDVMSAIPAAPRRRPGRAALLAAMAAQLVAGMAVAQIIRLEGEAEPALPADPAGARYGIDGEAVQLEEGRAERPAAPGSAATVVTRLVGEPVFADLAGDGDGDAVLWLVRETGGSGTFYYVATAFREAGGFRGGRAVLVGDRIVPGTLSVEHRIVTAAYLDRRPDEAMAARPTVPRTAYFRAVPGGLEAVAASSADAAPVHGSLVFGAEVEVFTPCGAAEPLWLVGPPDLIAVLRQRYGDSLPGSAPYSPLFATLTGRPAPPPAEGFGAEYSGAFEAAGLIQVWPAGNCISDRVIVETPLPGTVVSTPLAVSGRARGAWFFEGEVRLRLLDDERNVLAAGFATAEGEWMTKGFVPFRGTLAFRRPAGLRRGVLEVARNNVSDDRTLDEALEIPVVFE